jgi:hypothetical protein
MRQDHIINLLEERPLSNLSAAELEIIKAHTADCSMCNRAYEAAQASLLLLRKRASVAVEPPAFFETKVLAAIRERTLASKGFGFLNMWQTVRPVVLSMGALILMLVAQTFTDSSRPPNESAELALTNDDFAEWLVMGRDEADEMTDGQTLTVLYEPALDAGDSDGK